jgi:outer membrane receptor for ferrienterochelin and colicins
MASGASAEQQSPATGAVLIRVTAEAGPVAGALVSAGGERHTTGATGEVTLVLSVGERTVTVEKAGFLPQTIALTVAAGPNPPQTVTLVPAPVVTEDVIVTATRSGKRLQDEPLRVEVLGRDEIEEKLLMTPGDIAMMLNETAGLRVQVTSPSLGAAGIRFRF